MTIYYMKCLECKEVHEVGSNSYKDQDGKEEILIWKYVCPGCMKKKMDVAIKTNKK